MKTEDIDPFRREVARAALFNSGRKIQLDLHTLDGNAFCLMGAFQRQAKRERWNELDIRLVLDECKSGHNYDHLVQTLIKFTECPRDFEEEQRRAEVEELREENERLRRELAKKV